MLICYILSMKTFFVLLLAFSIPAFLIASFDRAVSHSMEPTLYIGDWYFENFFDRNIEIGDIATFECVNTQKCHGIYTHRLTSIDKNGCMSIEGDNQKNSLDTRDYGCLMPSEVQIYATDYPLKSFFSEKTPVTASQDPEDDMRAIQAEEEADQEDLYNTILGRD